MHCQVDTNHWRRPTFWKYLAIRVCLDILRASSLMLFEGALIVTIKEQVTIETILFYDVTCFDFTNKKLNHYIIWLLLIIVGWRLWTTKTFWYGWGGHIWTSCRIAHWCKWKPEVCAKWFCCKWQWCYGISLHHLFIFLVAPGGIFVYVKTKLRFQATSKKDFQESTKSVVQSRCDFISSCISCGWRCLGVPGKFSILVYGRYWR